MTLLGRKQRRSLLYPEADPFSIPPPGSLGRLASSGVIVNESTAMTIPVLLRGVTLLADSVSMLPLKAYSIDADGNRQQSSPSPAIVSNPFVNCTRMEGIGQIVHSLVLRGNAYVAIVMRDRQGYPSGLMVLSPDAINVSQSPDGSTVYRYGSRDIDPTALIHIKGLSAPQALTGVSIVENVRNNLGLTLAAQDFGSRLFSQGALHSGVIEVPEDLDPDAAKAMAASFRAMHSGLAKAHLPAVLTNGAKWQAISVTPEDAQFLQTRGFQDSQIATLLGIPPHLLGLTDKTTSWGTGIEVQGRAFVDYTLSPYLYRISQVFTSFLRTGQWCEFDTDQITRADTTTRYAGYTSALTQGWMCVDEVRAKENLPPLPGGKGRIYRHPATQVDADASVPEAMGAPVPVAPLDPTDPGFTDDGATE